MLGRMFGFFSKEAAGESMMVTFHGYCLGAIAMAIDRGMPIPLAMGTGSAFIRLLLLHADRASLSRAKVAAKLAGIPLPYLISAAFFGLESSGDSKSMVELGLKCTGFAITNFTVMTMFYTVIDKLGSSSSPTVESEQANGRLMERVELGSPSSSQP